MQEKLWKDGNDRRGSGTLLPGYKPGYNTPHWVKHADKMEMLGHGKIQLKDGASLPNVPQKFPGSTIVPRIAGYKFRPDKYSYDATRYGEAPENFLRLRI